MPMPASMARVSLVCLLTETETARFHKLLGQVLAAPGMKAKHLGEAIVQTLEGVLPGEDIRGRIAGKLMAVYMEQDFDGDRWVDIDPGPPDA